MPATGLRLAMIGLGTVGTGVAKLLTQRPEHLRSLGVGPLELKTVVVRDPAKSRGIDLGGARLTTDFDSLLADRDIDAVIEVMGGIEPARHRIAALLRAGKHVVTANKAVLAEHGRELFEIAHQSDRSILFEASVAGGIPILAALAETLCVNRIERISGIVNGTCNYILTAMHERGLAYGDALRQAQQLGFAEADPTLDVNGSDAAQKLAILARLAFQSKVDWRSISRAGIDKLDSMDLRFARELGYVIKLLAEGEVVGGKLSLQVTPKLVHQNHPLAQIRGEYNAIQVHGDAVGDLLFSGKGAGEMPTASSVVAGVIDLATGRGQQTFRALRLWETEPAGPHFDPTSQAKSRFYLRFTISDRPGTLARIASILGEHGISIASVIQHETPENKPEQPVPLIIMTHEASDGPVRLSLAEADRLEIARAPSVCLPVAAHA
ncbi:homoserine dehydrogenase [bacterium]|nr:homoserine dehydrogenase [bacterium]